MEVDKSKIKELYIDKDSKVFWLYKVFTTIPEIENERRQLYSEDYEIKILPANVNNVKAFAIYRKKSKEV